MKNLLLAFLLVTLFVSCKNKIVSKEKDTEITFKKIDAGKMYNEMLGSFVGDFGDNKITLLITKIANDSISGRSIVGGNDRPFAGTVSVKGGKFIVSANEPGSNKDDGSFNFIIDSANMNTVQGSWVPYKNTDGGKKDYILQRKTFQYKTDVGEYGASEKTLTDADVENLLKTELETMRNEIFARHGYCFKKKESRQYFENQEWYVPNSTDITKDLTIVEKKNIELIKRYEKYADDFGDSFGR